MQARVDKIKSLKPLVSFDGNIVLIGAGCIGAGILPMMVKLIKFDPKKMTIIDMRDMRKDIRKYLDMGMKYVHLKITEQNYKTILSKYLKSGDILLDLAYDIETQDLLDYCHKHNIRFLNTSVEEFNRFKHTKPEELTLYYRNQIIKEMANKWKDDKINPTAIMDCGANPGNVSCLTKKALVDIVAKLPTSTRKIKLQELIDRGYFNILAYELGLKVVHISERDTQITDKPKQEDEFVNTWSIPGFIEEGDAPAELGWGSHEKSLPKNALTHKRGNANQICLSTNGSSKYMRSWIKSGPIIGMLIRHGEAYSISDRLSVYPSNLKNPVNYIHNKDRHKNYTGERVIYRPTVHYVYLPCDGGLASMHEYRMTGKLQSRQRMLYNEILPGGTDELGCTLYGDFGIWWIGSLLSIDEARLYRTALGAPSDYHYSATNMQVASTFVACLVYIIKHPNEGVCFTDDVDYREVLNITKLFWGPMYSGQLAMPKELTKDFQFNEFEIHTECA